MKLKYIPIYAFILSIGLIYTACTSKNKPLQSDIEFKIDSLRKKMTEVKKEKMDLILTRLYKKGMFNGNVLIAEKGKILLKKSYGFADFQTKEKLNDNSVFRICSISKQFTATAIMILAEQGKLQYNDDVRKYLNQFPFENITIKHLLTHTSGLPDYLNYFVTDTGDMSTYANNQNVVSWVLNDTLKTNFTAGSAWEYSNTNYVLLSEIVKNISNQSFSSFLEANIFKPLEMNQAVLPDYLSNKPIPHKVRAYANDQETLFEDSFLDKIQGDGGVYASIEDLYKWDLSLYTEKIIKKTSLKEAYTPVQLSNGLTHNYGFGWHIKEDQKTYFHLGSWLGYKSALIRNPSQHNTIIILSNNTCPRFEEIVEMLSNILESKPYKIPK